MNDKELQLLVEEISIKFFEKPFIHNASFNNRLRTTGGRYLTQSHNIEINPKYYDARGIDELVGIIKHELCHYHLHIEGRGYKHRDVDFRFLLKKVGAPRFCQPLSVEFKKDVNHVYVCISCNLEYKRKRRINVSRYVCGRCKGKLKKLK